MTGALETTIAGERVHLLPSRGLYWGAQATLFVADIHLGKSQTLRAAGAPIPAGVLGETLDRLSSMIDAADAERVIVLGDLTHAPVGLTDDIVDRFCAWRAIHPVPMALVAGNHDRKLRTTGIADLCGKWGIEVLPPEARLGPFVLQHEPERTPTAHALAGHLHPAVTLSSGSDALKVPAFWAAGGTGDGGVTVLPAFSLFASGTPVRAEPRDRVWAVAPDRVIELGSPVRPPGRVRSRAR